MASNKLAKFFGHRDRGSRDIMILTFCVISQDHVIKGSCNFMGKNPSK